VTQLFLTSLQEQSKPGVGSFQHGKYHGPRLIDPPNPAERDNPKIFIHEKQKLESNKKVF